MSGARHMYTKSGRPIPPPPTRTPQRCSSVCRTPTCRCSPSEKLKKLSSRRCRSNTRDRWIVAARDERDQSPCRSAPNRTWSLIEGDKQPKQRNVVTRDSSPSARSVFDSKANVRPEEWRPLRMVEDRPHRDQSQSGYASSVTALVLYPKRSLSPHGGEYYEQPSITERLCSSFSRGCSPQRGRQGLAVVGTELMAPMPRLQGTRQTSSNRDRMTLERFIQSQPEQSKREMMAILEEYTGRERELCDALNDAYGDSWDVPLRSCSPSTNNSLNNGLGSAVQLKDKGLAGVMKKNYDENKPRDSESTFRSRSHEDVNADRRQWHTSPKSYLGVQSSASQALENRQRVNFYAPHSNYGVNHHGMGNHKAQSIEMGRCEDRLSLHTRQEPNGGGAPSFGTFLEYRETSPRPGGMLTPPIPHDLLAC